MNNKYVNNISHPAKWSKNVPFEIVWNKIYRIGRHCLLVITSCWRYHERPLPNRLPTCQYTYLRCKQCSKWYIYIYYNNIVLYANFWTSRMPRETIDCESYGFSSARRYYVSSPSGSHVHSQCPLSTAGRRAVVCACRAHRPHYRWRIRPTRDHSATSRGLTRSWRWLRRTIWNSPCSSGSSKWARSPTRKWWTPSYTW